MVLLSTKSAFLLAVVCLVFIQTAYASVFSQLQFIKISSPKNGDNVVAGKKLVVKYVMQPLIKSMLYKKQEAIPVQVELICVPYFR